MEQFKFTPEDGFRNTTSFPNPANGTDARNQFQTPLDQLKEYVNRTTSLYDSAVVRLKLDTNKRLCYSLDNVNWFTLYPIFRESSGKLQYSMNGTTWKDA